MMRTSAPLTRREPAHVGRTRSSGGRSVIAWEPGTSWRGRRIVRNTPVVLPRVLTLLLAAAIVLLVGVEPAFAGAANFTCRFGSLQIAADVHAGAGLLVSGSPTVERLRVPSYRSGGAGFTAVADRKRWDVWITGRPFGTSSSAKLVYRPRSGRRRQALGVCRIVSADHVLGLLESRFVRIRSAPHAGAAPLPRTAGAWPFVWATTRYRIDPASSHEWIHVEIVPIGAPSSVGWVARRDAGFVESSRSDGTSLLPLLNASA